MYISLYKYLIAWKLVCNYSFQDVMKHVVTDKFPCF